MTDTTSSNPSTSRSTLRGEPSGSDSKSSGQKHATSMAELMAHVTKKFQTFHRGDSVKGTITKLTSSEILADINAKTEALVLEKDRRLLRNLLATLKVGEEVTGTVLTPENELGQPVISLRRFMEGNAWDSLDMLRKNQQTLDVTVSDISKGGVVVETPYGVSGFLPQSHLALGEEPIVGKKLKVSVLELNKTDNKIIFSQKTNMPIQEFEDLASQFKTGQKIDVTVANVAPFGVFVVLTAKDGEKTLRLDGLIHISEISWDKVADISQLFTQGQIIQAVVIGIDRDGRRIDLSIKRLSADPFEQMIKQFPVDKKVTGIVKEISGGNIHIDLGDGAVGIIRKEKIPPTVTYVIEDSVNVTISEVDIRRHRILLTPVLLEKPIGYR